jgi:hypothetical protein
MLILVPCSPKTTHNLRKEIITNYKVIYFFMRKKNTDNRTENFFHLNTVICAYFSNQ